MNVEGTDIENIAGHAAFTNEEALLNVNAEAAGQQINVHGKIKHLLTTPYMDLQASSESFDPALILKNMSPPSQHRSWLPEAWKDAKPRQSPQGPLRFPWGF